MRWTWLLVVLTACGSGHERISGSPDMATEGDAAARTDGPLPQTSHTEKTCERERAWQSGRITLTGSARLIAALQPVFDSIQLELRDRVDKGCDWKLQLSTDEVASKQWVPLHQGSTSFWSTNAQQLLVVDFIDGESHTVSFQLSDLTIRADHAGDCEDLVEVEVRGSLGEENDEVSWISPLGDETRFGDLIAKPQDRQVSLGFSAIPIE